MVKNEDTEAYFFNPLSQETEDFIPLALNEPEKSEEPETVEEPKTPLSITPRLATTEDNEKEEPQESENHKNHKNQPEPQKPENQRTIEKKEPGEDLI